MNIEIHRISPGEAAWVKRQPVLGTPSIPRLSQVLVEAGLPPVQLQHEAETGLIYFKFCRAPATRHLSRDQILCAVIQAFRLAGLDLGFEEIAITDCDANFVSGVTAIKPLAQPIAKRGAYEFG
jgi:hypothetical protein